MTSTSPVDIVNATLSEIGANAISDFNDGSREAGVASIWYNRCRRQLLRAAPWGFARKTANLSLLAQATDVPNLVPWPYGFKYMYPADCLRMRYLLPPPCVETNPAVAPLVAGVQVYGGVRDCKFIIANDTDVENNQRRVVLSNLWQAQSVYACDVTDTSLFDDQFEQALASTLAFRMVIPLSGNKDMRSTFAQSAQSAIMDARASDGNEALPTTDHTPDWMVVRGNITPGYGGPLGFSDSFFGEAWQNMNWGM